MTYSGEFAPLLGPCRCQGCGETLWYARRQSRRMGITVPRIAWRDEDGLIHYCPNLPGRLQLGQRATRPSVSSAARIARRAAIVAAWEGGRLTTDVAREFGISREYVRQLVVKAGHVNARHPRLKRRRRSA